MGFRGQFALQKFRPGHVRYGSRLCENALAEALTRRGLGGPRHLLS